MGLDVCHSNGRYLTFNCSFAGKPIPFGIVNTVLIEEGRTRLNFALDILFECDRVEQQVF
jgi:hypothetical protein